MEGNEVVCLYFILHPELHVLSQESDLRSRSILVT